jgi:aspartokinase
MLTFLNFKKILLSMKSINKEIHNLINKHISVQKSLKRNIVNVRSLAKFLIDEYNLNYTLDSVISAIRRYEVEKVSLISSKETEKIFSQMSISTKDNVAKIVLKDKAFKEICEDFLGGKLLKENSRIVKGKERVTLIVSSKDLKAKMDLFTKADLLDVHDNLSEIRLHFPEDVTMQKGVLSRLTSELATRDINIMEIVISMPDILIYIKEKELVEAHHALREIKK